MIDGPAALRLQCACGRNLADVSFSEYNPDWTRDRLTVTPRPNVQQDDWRPWHEANQQRPTNPAPPGAVDRLREQLAARRAGQPSSAEPVNEWDPGEMVPERPELFDAEGGRIGDADDWMHRTYTWHCKCGLTHSRRHERISGVWAEWSGRSDGRPRVVVFGRHF